MKTSPKQAMVAVTREQMRRIDQLMIQDYHIALPQMMENAGRQLARLIAIRMEERQTELGPLIVMAGKGANGGGAMVAARHLTNWGYEVLIALPYDLSEYQGVPGQQLQTLQKIGLRCVQDIEQFQVMRLERPAVIVDGLVGYSLSGALRPPLDQWVIWANAQATERFALDIPTGLDADRGLIAEPVIRATATMTLALPKTGLMPKTSEAYIGELFLADIGVPPALYRAAGIEEAATVVFDHEGLIRLR